MTTPENDKILDKLKKLLRLSSKRDNTRHEDDEYHAGYADKDKINFNRPIEGSGKAKELSL